MHVINFVKVGVRHTCRTDQNIQTIKVTLLPTSSSVVQVD